MAIVLIANKDALFSMEEDGSNRVIYSWKDKELRMDRAGEFIDKIIAKKLTAVTLCNEGASDEDFDKLVEVTRDKALTKGLGFTFSEAVPNLYPAAAEAAPEDRVPLRVHIKLPEFQQLKPNTKQQGDQ